MKKIIGFILVAIPISVIFTWTIINNGLFIGALIIGLAVLSAAMIVYGLNLIFD